MPARMMIAAPSGRSGKTIITAGICAALRKRGLVVQAFKKGPDYIDPSWLTAASKRPCRNLDLYMMKKDVIIKTFYRASEDADISIIEANMGFYDGVKPDGRDSPAGLARLLDVPVIFVVNCLRITRSVAAIIQGFMGFEQGSNIKGVILNNVSGQRHEKKLTDSIKRHCHVPIIGVVPKSSSLNIKERHLGLIPFVENHEKEDLINDMARFFERYIDMDRILSIAEGPVVKKPHNNISGTYKNTKKSPRVKLGIFYDKVFSFYYHENLEALEKNGAELVYIDSMKDTALPNVHGLYIGGGFPELYGSEITKNRSLLLELKRAIEGWMPVYCECAGLMYVSSGIKTHEGFFEMAKIIPSVVEIKRSPQGHGYMEAEVITENPFFKKGVKIKGHEFHYSRLIKDRDLPCAFRVLRGHGIDGYHDGIVYKNMFASYMHIHAAGVPYWAKNFVQIAERYKNCNMDMQQVIKKGVYCNAG
ncbi:MAG TPA: hydrogenobyrinic acid a,c-diamide synthase (glutamine-hydrolyzing) [Syntrophorhabdaceae bacterium]|nr:hydrogenobyrinic acid a,c-diamide synthase (glutamine-hydrolyzing) [Syntrophorhabdaceae bacterium]